MSFLEMLDVVNEQLTLNGKDPIAFDHDCREGICGMCGAVVNGRPHGPRKRNNSLSTPHETFLRWRHNCHRTLAFEGISSIKDLATDRSALDQIIQAGGYVSVNTGSVPEANTIMISQETAELAMDAAACIGCGACAAACPNGSSMLFTGAKVSQLALLPQGKPEAATRAAEMVRTMDACGFGNCTNEAECEAE